VLVVVLRRKRVVLVRGDFIAAVHTPIDTRVCDHDAGLTFGVEVHVVTLAEAVRVFVESHGLGPLK